MRYESRATKSEEDWDYSMNQKSRMYKSAIQLNLQCEHWINNKPQLLMAKAEYHLALLRLIFDNLNTAVETLEVFHSLFLYLNRSNRWGCVNLWFEPAVQSSRIWWRALTCSNWKSRHFCLWAVGEALLLLSLLGDNAEQNWIGYQFSTSRK